MDQLQTLFLSWRKNCLNTALLQCLVWSSRRLLAALSDMWATTVSDTLNPRLLAQ